MTERVLTTPWFRRDAYAGENSAGDVPRWHRAWRMYLKSGVYSNYRAVCGYSVDGYQHGVTLSKAKRLPAGPVCKKCLGES